MTSAAAGRIVVVDGMGHDEGPRVVVDAALTAVAAGARVTLVLDDPLAEAVLRQAPGGHLEVLSCSGSVGMAEDPATVMRERPNVSIRVAAERTSALLDSGHDAALLSAGPTGATLAAAVLELGRCDDVRRPVLAARLPRLDLGGPDGPVEQDARGTIVVDVGAQPDLDAAGLLAAGQLGRAYARDLGVREPRLGLLAIGTEPGKCHAAGRAVEAELRGQPWFAGNVEPDGVLRGDVDVVLCDGFSGNVLLKTVEALAPERIRREAAARLLGVRGRVLVAHGAVSSRLLTSAIRAAVAAPPAQERQRVVRGRTRS